jgi:hypothetical protein
MSTSVPGRLAAAAALLLVGIGPAHAADPKGVLWESTSRVVLPGMPSGPPPTTVKVCTKEEWTEPPPGGDESCESSDFQRVGDKVTWKTKCTGDMPMTGTGEITFQGEDSYTGAIRAKAEGVDMTIELSGKKLGTCEDPK